MYELKQMREDELAHFGILGMKWGKHKATSNYNSTGLRSAIARKKNEKVDAGFKNWKENSQKRDNAIGLGKKATEAKRAYSNNKSDKNLKSAYKQSNKEYKKALRSNTTYRKGVVKGEVGKDAARKYLSDAKKVKKQLTLDPNNKQLKKQYNRLMSKHDVERAKARRAPEVANNRMRKKASMKRAMTMTVKAAGATAAIGTGAYFAKKYLNSHNVTLNGKPVTINSDTIRKYANAGKSIIGLGKYI